MIEIVTLSIILVISSLFMIIGYGKDIRELFFTGAIAFVVGSVTLSMHITMLLLKQFGG